MENDELIGVPSEEHLKDIEKFRQKNALKDLKTLSNKITDLNDEFKKHPDDRLTVIKQSAWKLMYRQ